MLADFERAAGCAVLAQAKQVGSYFLLAELVRRTAIMRRQLADRLDVERLRSSSQPGQGHVLDHPRTQWRHGGLLSLMRRRARPRATASTKYTPSAITPAFTTRALGEAVPSNGWLYSGSKGRLVCARGWWDGRARNQ